MPRRVDAELAARLAGLSHGEWASLLLEVAHQRASARGPADVMQQFLRDGYTRPSALDQRVIHQVDGVLLDALPADFEAVELSPVAPLGTVSAVALAHQDKVCSAQRSLEVVSDPTNVMALMAAQRRRSQDGPVRLFTSHRALRMPRVGGSMSWQHFRLACWVSAGRDPGGRSFERESLALHVGTQIAVLERFRALGLPLGPVSARVWVDPSHSSWVEPLIASLNLPIRERAALEPGAYYRWVRVMLDIEIDGTVVNIGDAGFVDWVANLANSRKERTLISALGTERLAALWPAGTVRS